MSELLCWFTNQVKPTIDRPRARNYANFVTSLCTLEELVERKAPVSAFIEAFETMQPCSTQGFASKPGVALLRRRFDWVNARGFLDLVQSPNATKKPYTQDTLLAVSTYHIPTRRWHIGMFAESADVQKAVPCQDTYPFPSQTFHAFSFERRPNFDTFATDHPDTMKTLRQLSIERRGRRYEDRVLGECFVKRIVRGPYVSNLAFPHL